MVENGNGDRGEREVVKWWGVGKMVPEKSGGGQNGEREIGPVRKAPWFLYS